MLDRAPLSRRASVKIALITFLVLSAISLAVLLSLPKTYVATTRIEVERRPSDSTASPEVHDPDFIQSEFEKIKSDEVLTRAVWLLRQNLQLQDLGRTRGAPADEQVLTRQLLKHLDLRQSRNTSLIENEGISKQLRKQLELRQSRNTSLIEIRFTDRNPEHAAEIANTIASVYADQEKRNSGPGRTQIIDEAQPPTRPISPNIPKLLAIATILNTLLAIFAGFFASNLFR